MNKIILVTGGAGFIGSHTCLLLLESGYKVVVIDSFINSSLNSLERVKKILISDNNFFSNRLKIVKGDLRDFECINNIFLKYKINKEKIDGVIHFAGLKNIKESISDPISYWENNVTGTINLLKAMHHNNCNSIIFSSTAALYGKSESKVFKETSIKSPINPYGETKLAIEKLLNDLYKSNPNSWKIANLRYFNPIGCHNSGQIGESPLNKPTNIFPLIIKAASKEIKKISIFGNDWPTHDGTGIRDYIHVMDLAEGHIKAIEFLMSKNKGNLINLNLGRGVGVSVLELINTFTKVNNVNIEYEFAERREGDVPISIADNCLAKTLLNWCPKRDIEEMCIDGWKWKLLNPKGY
ncbi:UDP-glucose 4-epimerase GalE [Prochlorococcus marinus]|uniref:UDP-glucose 4-epimerase n=1 Tax=Prochlorococcus marinus (strain MIT 9301) TaxID=167546 RepID=A3PE72_PROM0|nr:UDP-glucose 4-epimerase GalE [Prochlorococcus marinus]ABO18047.1 UDP-glucose 4-epimerase [Prochlorococcus marinus str. MIT 9301]